ncbi:hypothetical protein ACIP17_19515, partial [Streptomyces iakyrus]
RTDTSERRPGAWPTSAKSQSQPAAQTHGATTPNRPGAWPTVRQPPSPSPASSNADAFRMWPRILEAVKERRRFAWIVISQHAKLAAFDGTEIVLNFASETQREIYRTAGLDAVLEQAIREDLKLPWKVSVTFSNSAPTKTFAPDTDRTRPPGEWPATDTEKVIAKTGKTRPQKELQAAEEPREGSSNIPAPVTSNWEEILEAVKGQRRFAWILLSYHAEVVQFNKNILRLRFDSDSARDNYWSAGVNEVLGGVLEKRLGTSFRVEIDHVLR